MAAVAIVVGAIVGGAFMADEYSSVGETISQLTDPGEPAAGLVRGGILAYSLLLVPLAAALVRGAPDDLPFRRLAGLALCLHVAGAIVASVFANDSPRTIVGGVTFNAVHDRAGQSLYVAAIAATFFLAASATMRVRPLFLLAAASALAFSVMLFNGIGLFFERYPAIPGLEERTGLGAFQVWLLLVSRWREPSRE